RDQEADARQGGPGHDHDARLDPIEEPADARHDESRGEGDRRLQERDLRAALAELRHERRDEHAGRVVAGAEDQEERREEARDDDRALAFRLHPAPSSNRSIANVGTGVEIPFTGTAGIARTRKRPSSAARTGSVTSTSTPWTRVSSSTRAARFTVLPITPYSISSRLPITPAMTGPR